MNRPGFNHSRPEHSDWSFLLLGCLLAVQSVIQTRAALGWGHDSWQLTEWLINYSGGFVRRGLPGEFAGWMSHATGMPANNVVIITAILAFLSLLTWLLRHTAGLLHPALVVSCVIMGFPAYQDSIIRKDCLGMLLFIACIRADASGLPGIARMALTNLCACTAILSHEAFAMYALPALWFYPMLRDGSPDFKKVLVRTASFMPSLACFVLTIRYHGTEDHSRLINQSWLPLWRITDPGSPDIAEPSAAIAALSWTAEKGVSLGMNLLTSGLYQPLAWLALFIISFVFILRFTSGKAAPGTRTRIASILLLQLLCISPLFILGYDYGRWLFLWAGTSTIILATGLEPPAYLQHRLAAISSRLSLDRISNAIPSGGWQLLCFGVPVCWNLHAFVDSIPLVRHARMIWHAF